LEEKICFTPWWGGSFNVDRWSQDVNAAFFPAVDAYWENKKIEVKIDLAGFKFDDIHIELKKNVLIVDGKRDSIDKENEKITPIMLHRPLKFRTLIPLGFDLKDDDPQPQIKASKKSNEDGVLSITIDKLPALNTCHVDGGNY